MAEHKRGDRVTVRWPNGPHDFVLKFDSIRPEGQDGWVLVTGLVVEPQGPKHRAMRSFYVRPDGDGYALLPMIKP